MKIGNATFPVAGKPQRFLGVLFVLHQNAPDCRTGHGRHSEEECRQLQVLLSRIRENLEKTDVR